MLKEAYRNYVQPFIGTAVVVVVVIVALKHAKPYLPAVIANKLP